MNLIFLKSLEEFQYLNSISEIFWKAFNVAAVLTSIQDVFQNFFKPQDLVEVAFFGTPMIELTTEEADEISNSAARQLTTSSTEDIRSAKSKKDFDLMLELMVPSSHRVLTKEECRTM